MYSLTPVSLGATAQRLCCVRTTDAQPLIFQGTVGSLVRAPAGTGETHPVNSSLQLRHTQCGSPPMSIKGWARVCGCALVFKSSGEDGGAGASKVGKENKEHCSGINEEKEIR